MQYQTEILTDERILKVLGEIPKPPTTLYIRGVAAPPTHRIITIVGSRACSEYGQTVVEEICSALKSYPVSIVSGLAIGIDGHAHISALKHGLHTMAVVGSGLRDDVLYPRQHRGLAKRILDAGGALISENNPSDESKFWMFPARNRIMVGMSELVIIIEARQKSGTCITARLATDYNRDLLVVPNSIYSIHAKGSNELIKQGAYMYTQPKDLLDLLGFETPQTQTHIEYTYLGNEKIIFEALSNGHTTPQAIIDYCISSISVSQAIQTLLDLEIKGQIRRIDGVYINVGQPF